MLLLLIKREQKGSGYEDVWVDWGGDERSHGSLLRLLLARRR